MNNENDKVAINLTKYLLYIKLKRRFLQEGTPKKRTRIKKIKNFSFSNEHFPTWFVSMV